MTDLALEEHGLGLDAGAAGRGADRRPERRTALATLSARWAARPTGSPSSSTRSPTGRSWPSAASRTCGGGPWRRSASAAWPPAGARTADSAAPAPRRRPAQPARRPGATAASSCGCAWARRRSRFRRGGAYCLDVLTGDAPEAVARGPRARCARRARRCACACRRSSSTPTRSGWRRSSRWRGTPSSCAIPALLGAADAPAS